MSSIRSQRVADSIQRCLAELLRRARDPRFPQVTITAVDMSPDLANATIFVSVLDETQAVGTVSALNKASGYFRHELVDMIDLRIMPKLQFRFDDSISRGARIDELLK